MGSERSIKMVLIFLADGFEEIEALTQVDVLKRAEVEIEICSVGHWNRDPVTGSHGIKVTPDLTAYDAWMKYGGKPLEMIILPGGMPGTVHLDEDELVDRFLKKAEQEGTIIAAICAAPMVLGKRGLLSGRRATCYPGFEKDLKGATVTGGRVETDGNRITGCGMGASTEFALALCAALKGEKAAEKLREAIMAK